MNFGGNACGQMNIISFHLNRKNIMKNKFKILFLSFGLLFAACTTANTEKAAVDNTTVPTANTETAANNTAKSDNPFPPPRRAE